MAKQIRPPVITIMGHVDHGKTTLLDYLRHSRIAAKEAGGITQHIGAYQVEHKGKLLTFIDTPGHAAFNKMRARGAAVTDLVILVVAANDGVKPQTIESIRHIKEAKVPVLVAINKIDLPNVYLDVVKGELAEQGILVTGFGGDTEVVEISALKGQGIDKLLDTLLVMAELNNFTADPAAPLQAVVIESAKDSQKGVVASVIVKEGTLKIKQDIFTDTTNGRIKLLTNDRGQSLASVLPGCPAELTGFKEAPVVGSIVRDLAATYQEETKVEVAEPETAAQDNVQVAATEPDFSAWFEKKPRLPLIMRADVEGTLEAILSNLDDESVELLDFGIGEITEKDLDLAEASGATIIAFHIKTPKRIVLMAKQRSIKLKSYDVIYHLIEDLQKQMLKLMEPTIDEVVTGEAEILQIFEMRGEKIAGVKIKSGEIKKHDLFHLKRGEAVIANPVIKTMMHGKEEVTTATIKHECGLTFKNRKLDFQIGDLLVAYKKAEE